jgi:hypothetical protein
MNHNINSAWSATSVVLKASFSFYEIKDIVGLAGFDIFQLTHLVQYSGNSKSSTSKGQLITEIEKGLLKFSDQDKQHFLNIVIEEILNRNIQLEQQLEQYLTRLGWQIIDKYVIPIDILDKDDLNEIDQISRDDLLKAAKRFRDGDLSGAISAACGAVDSITAKIYQSHNMNDFGKTSFQERCKTSLKLIGFFTEIENELKDINWKGEGVVPFTKNVEGALNQASYIMQSLRVNMSDVHGTKPVLKPLVFDSIKWSQIIVRLLS